MRTEGTSRVLVSSQSLRGEMASNLAASLGRRSMGSLGWRSRSGVFQFPFGLLWSMVVRLVGSSADSKEGDAVTGDPQLGSATRCRRAGLTCAPSFVGCTDLTSEGVRQLGQQNSFHNCGPQSY